MYIDVIPVNHKLIPGYLLPAALRAALQYDIAPEKMYAWKQFIFDLFAIKGSKNSYLRLIRTLQEPGGIKILAEAVAEHQDYKKLGLFIATFLNPGWGKYQDQVAYEELLDELIMFHEKKNSQGKEKEMPLKIIDCELKNLAITVDQQMQIIKYIDIPEQTFEELSQDFKYAKHLDFLNEIAKEVPKKLLLVAKQELGLLACKYLSSLLDKDENAEDFFFEEQDLMDKFPVIKSKDLNFWYGSRPVPNVVFSDPIGLEYTALREQNTSQPWWTIYEEIPLIVIIESEWFLKNDLLEKLKLLEQTHRTIWIIYIVEESPGNSPRLLKNHFGDHNNHKLAEDIYWILNYPTYKIEEPDIVSEYCQMVLKTAVAQHGYEIAPEVDMVELLKTLKKRRGNLLNQTIIEMANKAVALKNKDTTAILYQADFLFVGRFLTELWQIKSQEQTRPQANAVDQMNKKIWGLKQVKKQIMETVNIGIITFSYMLLMGYLIIRRAYLN